MHVYMFLAQGYAHVHPAHCVDVLYFFKTKIWLPMYVQSADLCAWIGGGLQVELYKLMMWRVVTYVNEIHCKIWISAEVGSIKSDINSLKACPDMFVKQEIFSPQKLHIWVDLTILWVEVISSIHHSPPLGILFIQSLLSQHTHYQYPQDSAREMNFPHEWEDPERFNLDTHSGITQKAKPLILLKTYGLYSQVSM